MKDKIPNCKCYKNIKVRFEKQKLMSIFNEETFEELHGPFSKFWAYVPETINFCPKCGTPYIENSEESCIQ